MNNFTRLRMIAAAVTLLFASSANATLILDGPSGGPSGGASDVERVVYDDFLGQQGMTVTGALDTSGFLVDFTSNEDLITSGTGPAGVYAFDGALTMLSIEMQDSTIGMTKLQFNIEALIDGFATITLSDQFGTDFVFGNQALDANSANWFTGLGLDGQMIVKATIDSSVPLTGLSDIHHFRVRPETTLISLPEPGALPLAGIGLLMAFGLRRRTSIKAH